MFGTEINYQPKTREEITKWAESAGWFLASSAEGELNGASAAVDGWLTPNGLPVEIYYYNGRCVSSFTSIVVEEKHPTSVSGK